MQWGRIRKDGGPLHWGGRESTGVLRTVNVPNTVKCAKVPGRFRVRRGYVRRALSNVSGGIRVHQSQSPFFVEAILYLEDKEIKIDNHFVVPYANRGEAPYSARFRKLMYRGELCKDGG